MTMRALFRSLSALPLDRLRLPPDLLLAGFVAVVVAMLIVPLPSPVVDGLLAVNVAGSFIVLLVALFARSALEVTTFPSLLLVSTLFRLALNVSTTRGILAHGAAGEVVQAFGRFVIQGDLVVGLVVFLVITLVQFLVIAKGAERVAEVAARFTLDAMPGKQMSIDAALRSGALSEEQAEERRHALGRESQLFGAMDGAMKFVKGDAVAGLVITGVNLVGGFMLGLLRYGLTAAEAAETYALLTVGDALVSQIPALLITLAAGMLVTRVEAKDKREDLGGRFRDELLSNPKVLGSAAALCGLVGVVPGLPAIPFLLIGAALAGLAVPGPWLRRGLRRPAAAPLGAALQAERLAERVAQAKAQRALADQAVPAVVPISVELGPELSRALGFTGGDDAETELLGSLIPQLRDALYLDTGVRVPGVQVRSFVAGLSPGGLLIRVKDVPVAAERVDVELHLALESPERLRRLGVQAQPAQHPLMNATVSAISAAEREVVAAAGVPLWSPAGVVALHLGRVLRKEAKAFIGIQEVGELVERLEKAYPMLVREVVPKLVNLQQLGDVLRRLVDEGVSIRDLKTIVEALGDAAEVESDGLALTEAVRAALSRQIAHAHAGLEHRLSVLLLDPVIEDTIRGAIRPVRGGCCLALEPELNRGILRAVARALQPAVLAGSRPVILTTADVRRFVRKVIEAELPQIAVLSFEELPDDLSVQPLGRATIDALAAA